MKGIRRALLCLLALLPLTGCEGLAFPRELEATMLVQVLGVDWTAQGVVLTAAADPNTGGGDAKGVLVTAQGDTLAQAKDALKGAGEEYVALTHVAQLVLGEDTDLAAVLEEVLLEPTLGQGATVWLAREGAARALLEGAGGGAKRLSSIELNAGVEPVSVLEGLMRLEEEGWLALPVLELKGETLAPAGTKVVWKEIYGT